MQKIDWLKAAWQFISLFVVTVIGSLLGLVLIYPVIITWLKFKYQVLKKPIPKNFVGEDKIKHKDKYFMEDYSSGEWSYWNVSKDSWFWLWGNDEDGYLGEPSGKHSAREDGKERSWLAMYRWSIRNPFNNAKRYWSPMRCEIDDCNIEWIGEGDSRDTYGNVILNDNEPLKEGWYFVKATHKETGKIFYGYRKVKRLKYPNIEHARIGFKIKPKHAQEDQDEDDAVKGFTFRYTRWAKEN